MDTACPKEHVTEILSDSDHSTKVAPTTLNGRWLERTELNLTYFKWVSRVNRRRHSHLAKNLGVERQNYFWKIEMLLMLALNALI